MSDLQEPSPDCDRHGVSSVIGTKLPDQILYMEIHCRLGD